MDNMDLGSLSLLLHDLEQIDSPSESVQLTLSQVRFRVHAAAVFYDPETDPYYPMKRLPHLP